MLSRPQSPEFAPERALPSLPWLAALALLVVNDHVLKGSGLLPGVVTGKLSDLAGMIVAPALLATLIRARSTPALLACHVAVGLVFAGIQLSVPFADLWSAAMGLIGFPWVITSDPTDLLALPMLVVAWRVLVPMMATAAPERLPLELRSLAVGSASVAGLWASVATSQVDAGIDTENTWYEDVYANVVINNANDHDVSLFVRALRPEVALDCDAIASDPGRLVPANAFGEAVYWTLPPRTNLPVLGAGACGVAWVGGEGVPPTILFWRDEFVETWHPGQYFVGEALPASATALVFDELGATWVGGESFRFAVDTSVPEQDESCVTTSDERVDWDTNIPYERPLELVGLDYGVDGCFALELLDLWWESSSTAYLCVPEAALPFAVGDRIRVQGGGANWLQILLLTPGTEDVALDSDGSPLLTVDLLRGSDSISELAAALGPHDTTVIPRPSCEWLVDDACSVVERPFELAITGVAQLVAAGDEPVVLADPIGGGDAVRERELTLLRAQERALLDSSCADGAPLLGLDLDAIVVSRPAQP